MVFTVCLQGVTIIPYSGRLLKTRLNLSSPSNGELHMVSHVAGLYLKLHQAC